MSQSYETFGKYILLERLAMGGMAEIYLARSLAAAGVSKFFAIKRILPQYSEQVEFIDMFKDEAKIAVNLSHANIVSIYEFGMEKEAFYLAMDYVEGSNLRQILNKMKKSGVGFSIEQVTYIIKEVAAGLDAAHRCIDAQTGKPLNIIHRDMSPQNVMISFEGEVKVVDFGIAKAETQIETTRAGTLKGKFGYMSPEQAEGQQIDLRTDIFALGIVLWELLANDRLFVANNEVNTLRKIRDCQIPSLRKINPNIPQELERIVTKALAKDRNLRYQTCAAFQRDLSKFLNRQAPDFSPHDFSVFNKTLFAGEILERRKKMIEYAKVDTKMIAAPAAPTAPVYEHTVVTSTNSITENTNGRGPAKDLGTPEPAAKVEARAKPAPRVEARIEAKASGAPKPLTKGPAVGNRPPASPNPSAKELTAPAESGLSFERNNFRDRMNQSEPGISNSGFSSSGSRNAYLHSRTNIELPKETSSFPTFAVLLIVGLVGGSAAFYYSNPEKILQFASKNGISVARFLGQGNQVDNSSTNSPSVQTHTDLNHYAFPISSNPPGAAILINNRMHSDVTPTTIQLDENADVKITLRMPGYVDFNQTIHVTGPKTISAKLDVERRGRLYVNVVGAGQIKIDGFAVQAAANEPFTVPADREILVSVYDPASNTGDELRLVVGEGQTRKITLIPKVRAAANQ